MDVHSAQPKLRQTAPHEGHVEAAAPPRSAADLSCMANCCLSTALAAILCRRRCDAGQVIAEFAFFPPDPPSYVVKDVAEDGTCAAIEYNYRELDADPAYARLKHCDGSEGRPRLRLLSTARQERVPSFFFEARGAELCVVYLHANATDCGAMLPTYATFSRRLRVSVLAVEYCGYGAASGKCSVRNVHADARAASDEATRLGYPPESQVLYGQSVGSGPACHLAARRRVRGVVLHSPVASGIRALAGGGCCSPVHVYACLDPFNNVREVARISAPVFVVHGTHDEEIPFAHGQMLSAAARRPHAPFWVAGAGHNNIVETAKDEYFTRMRSFLDALHLESAQDAPTKAD
ncbi:Alpha/Beta hydrolase protein [Pelagophyceae sp. CCMP2097]|nr:Alpha/Beta hydrolase protein [Pelagophyceae sp. CCMP2097]